MEGYLANRSREKGVKGKEKEEEVEEKEKIHFKSGITDRQIAADSFMRQKAN